MPQWYDFGVQGTEQLSTSPTVTKDSAPADKIQLFRSLFRHREDVYPRRFESRKDQGYSSTNFLPWLCLGFARVRLKEGW